MQTITKNSLRVFALCLMTFTAGCGDTVLLLGGEGIPDETFMGIDPVFTDGSSVGNLTEAYVKNTESLTIVNGRLAVLCKAHEISNCTGPQ